MKKLKYLLFIFVIFLTPSVFALDYDVTDTITSPVSPSGAGTYTGEEQNGTTSSWNVKTRYNGLLQRIRYNIPLPSNWADGSCYSTNNTYTITMNMATDDWRNRFGSVRVVPYSSYSTNWSSGVVTFVSYKKIYFTFTIPTSYTTCVQSVYVDLPSSATFTPFTGDTNWNLSKVILTDPMASSGGGSSGGGSSGATNQDVINSNNQNTQNVIDSQNENTNNIIENNNQNTEIINNSLNSVCKSGPYNITETFIDKSLIGKELKNDGSIGNWSSASISKYLSIKPNEDYTIYFSGGSVNAVYYCLYTADKTVLSCSAYSNRSEINFNSGQYASFLRLTVPNYRIMSIKGSICNDFSIDAQNDTINAINETNSYLKDDSDPAISDNEFTSLFNNVGFNDPLSYLLQLPVQFINQLVSQSNTCQTISLGTLWGVSLTLPCIDIGSIIGQQVWDIIDVLFSVGLLVVIFKNLYQTFANLMTMGGEKEAREKFSMPTPMEFLSVILGGDR